MSFTTFFACLQCGTGAIWAIRRRGGRPRGPDVPGQQEERSCPWPRTEDGGGKPPAVDALIAAAMAANSTVLPSPTMHQAKAFATCGAKCVLPRAALISPPSAKRFDTCRPPHRPRHSSKEAYYVAYASNGSVEPADDVVGGNSVAAPAVCPPPSLALQSAVLMLPVLHAPAGCGWDAARR
jgi:hypothetical protein